MDSTKQLLSIHAELHALLEEIPSGIKKESITDRNLWKLYNSIVDRLVVSTSISEFEACKVIPEHGNYDVPFIDLIYFRVRIRTLADRIATEFLNVDPSTKITRSSYSPDTVINQFQSQIQNTDIIIQIEIKNTLDELLEHNELADNEKKFIENLKEKLVTIKSISDFIVLVINTARNVGLTLDQILKLFGGIL